MAFRGDPVIADGGEEAAEAHWHENTILDAAEVQDFNYRSLLRRRAPPQSLPYSANVFSIYYHDQRAEPEENELNRQAPTRIPTDKLWNAVSDARVCQRGTILAICDGFWN